MRPALYDTQTELTEAVILSMRNCEDKDFSAKLAVAVRGLHELLRVLKLTEAEFGEVINFLTRVGQACDAKHNEGILLADLLGLSTLVMLLNGEGRPGEKDGALLGPFYREGAPLLQSGGSIIKCDTPGEPLQVYATVTDHLGQPLQDVEVAVWQSSPKGLYENQDAAQTDMNLRGRFMTDAKGRFWFHTVKPAGYPVPTHGPAGELLHILKRSPFRPAHIHFILYHEGFDTLITQRFFDTPAALEGDAVFGARDSLVGTLGQQEDGSWRSDCAFLLRPGKAHWPRPPID